MPLKPDKHIQPIEHPFISLEISDDRMTAFGQILDFSLPMGQIAGELKKVLIAAGITRGLIMDNIKQLLRDRNPNQKLAIATGRKAVAGRAGEIKELVTFFARPDLDVEKFQVSHIKELKHPNLVLKGAPLLNVTPPRPARDGFTVTGERLPASGPKNSPDFKFELGEHVSRSPENPQIIIAEIDGLATYQNDRVSIKPILVIPGNVSLENSPVHYPGTVIVMGDVKAGTKIEAGQDIEVYGTVEDAVLQAERDILIYQGFVGHGKGKVSAQRHVILAFALYQKINAGHTLLFFKELIGCKVFARKNIIARTGGIIGGYNEALEKILLHFAGSEEAVKTQLVVGRRSTLMEKRRELDELIQHYQELLRANKQQIYDLVIKQLDDLITEEEEAHLSQLQMQKRILPSKIQEIEAQLTTLNSEVGHLENAAIEIRGILHEKVSLAIGDARLNIKEKTRRRLFRVSGNRIVAHSL